MARPASATNVGCSQWSASLSSPPPSPSRATTSGLAFQCRANVAASSAANAESSAIVRARLSGSTTFKRCSSGVAAAPTTRNIEIDDAPAAQRPLQIVIAKHHAIADLDLQWRLADHVYQRLATGRDRCAVEQHHPALGVTGGVIDVHRSVVLDRARTVVDYRQRDDELCTWLADFRVKQPISPPDFIDVRASDVNGSAVAGHGAGRGLVLNVQAPNAHCVAGGTEQPTGRRSTRCRRRRYP